MGRWLDEWLIPEWREAWRFSSLWLNTTGFAVLVMLNAMPPSVRRMLPEWVELYVIGGWWLAVTIARLTAQHKAQAKIDAKRAAQKGLSNG